MRKNWGRDMQVEPRVRARAAGPRISLGIVAAARWTHVAYVLALVCALVASSCAGTRLGRQLFEYEEEIYLDVDGTATMNVNASVASLVALRGADLPLDPQARLDRQQVRDFFSGPGSRVTGVSLSRRNGRRFVHLTLDVDDIRRLPSSAPFAWSTYRLDRQGDVVEFRHTLGKAAGLDAKEAGWRGDEMVRFRVHVPSEIPFHNSPGGVGRGNILTWAQPLAERADGVPLDMQFQMEPESILYSTLLLFGGTILAAACAFGIAIWFLVKRGRRADAIES